MSHFLNNYNNIIYNIDDSKNNISWLRNSQLWAIHSIASYFTTNLDLKPWIVVLPTWTWKTAVLNLAPYILRSNRVLVLTSNVAVRWQIFEEFNSLNTLKSIWVFSSTIFPPNVKEIKKKFKSIDDLEDLKQYDVIVSLPWTFLEWLNSFWGIWEDFFDLILVDEAHHVAADTWKNLINFFSNSKKIYFTATPYRRDKKEIPWDFIYTYTVSQSYLDWVFWNLEFINVKWSENTDLDIAQTTEKIYKEDIKKWYKHFIMVRTESKKESKVIELIYKNGTSLKLKRVDSSISYNNIKKVLSDLKESKLDWIICVDMLWEWFDLPNLKIAAIHTPKKSLSNTIQFIWRFARTNSNDVWSAKFIWTENDIKFWKIELYKEWAIWNEIFSNLNDKALKKEKDIRDVLNWLNASNKDFSSYSLHPYLHVRCYSFKWLIKFSANINELKIFWHTIFNYSFDDSYAIIVTNENKKPKWITSSWGINDIIHHLIILYYNEKNWHLFLHSSNIKTDSFYNEIINNFTNDNYEKIPKNKIHKVLLWIKDPKFFNLWLQSNVHNWESYKIIAWSNSENSINKSDWQMYSNWHVFWSWLFNNDSVTIWYSSWSKIWSNSYYDIQDFISWCNGLSNKIVSKSVVKTNTWLDYLPLWEVVKSFPLNGYWVMWNKDTFFTIPEKILIYKYDENEDIISTTQESFLNFNIKLENNIKKDDIETIILLYSNINNYKLKFSFNNHYEILGKWIKVTIIIDWEEILLIDYLNENPLCFYLDDFSTIINNNEFIELNNEDLLYDINKKYEKKWKILNKVDNFKWNDVNIQIEFYDNKKNIKKWNDKKSVQEKIKEYLLSKWDEYDIIIYDHWTWEIADYITIKEFNDIIYVEFYHIKWSKWPKSWDRVEDVYEVCMQAVKSQIYIDTREKFKNKINERIDWDNNKLIKWNLKMINEILDKNLPINYDLIIVQPWISKNNISKKVSTTLAASDEFLIHLWYKNWLRIICS